MRKLKFMLRYYTRKHSYVLITCAVLLLMWWFLWNKTATQRTTTRIQGPGREVIDGFQPLPRLYKGLEIKDGEFMLNNKPFRILSGSIHYFRVPPSKWKDRLMKLKAAGLNTVQTYVAWNLHEPTPGKFDFTGICDIRQFIKTAKELGIYVIVRPGPYICAEWEYGGLPAWLLKDKDMKVRSTYPPFLSSVSRFFDHLFQVLHPLQASNGGPIIAFQVENEYLSFQNDTNYLTTIYKMFQAKGLRELLFTSDGSNFVNTAVKMLPDKVLVAVNFMRNPKESLQTLRAAQPTKPLYVAEYWSGWFMHWKEEKKEFQSLPTFKESVATMLEMNASINFYMFHGGTNFGFMNGANVEEDGQYEPTITSYDYEAPVNEWGKPTKKYYILRDLLTKMVPQFVPHPLPPIPASMECADYDMLKMAYSLPLLDTIAYTGTPTFGSLPLPMESLSVHGGVGQNYGFTMYRTTITRETRMLTIEGLKDYGVVLLEGSTIKEVSWTPQVSFPIDPTQMVDGESQLDILVENMGRVNYVHSAMASYMSSMCRKGITGNVKINDKVKTNWKMYSFEFDQGFCQNIDSGGLWQRVKSTSLYKAPTIYKTALTVNEIPHDTFADMSLWGKGILIVNNVNVGRYWEVGPQKSLYIPSSILKQGINKIMVLELKRPSPSLTIPFRKEPL